MEQTGFYVQGFVFKGFDLEDYLNSDWSIVVLRWTSLHLLLLSAVKRIALEVWNSEFLLENQRVFSLLIPTSCLDAVSLLSGIFVRE